jgi:hypothetical protein
MRAIDVSGCIVLVGGSMSDIGLNGGYEELNGFNGKKKHWQAKCGKSIFVDVERAPGTHSHRIMAFNADVQGPLSSV